MTASKREQPKASGTAGLEVLIVEAINSFFIIPKIAAVDNVVGPVARAPKTEVGGADDGNSNSRFHVAEGC